MTDSRQRILWCTCALLTMVLCLAGRLVAVEAPRGAAGTWHLLWGLLILLSFVWALRSLDDICAHPFLAESKALGVLLVFPFLWSDLGGALSGAALLPLLLVFLGLSAARRGKQLSAGSLLGLAALFRPALLHLLPWLIYRLRLRPAAGFGLALFSGILALWLLQGPGGPGLIARPGGLLGALARAGPEPDGAEDRSLFALIRLLDLSSPVAWIVYSAAVAAAACVLLVLSWRRRPGLRLRISASEVSAALAAATLLGPFTTVADFAHLLPAAALGWEASRHSSSRVLRRVAGLLWIAAFLASGASFPALPESLQRLPLALLSALCLVVVVAYPRFYPTTRSRPAAREGAGAPRGFAGGP